MEPRIIAGKKYQCKKNVNKDFIKGKIYIGSECNNRNAYPDPKNRRDDDKHLCGFITNEQGHAHAWPYLPEEHLWCHDGWTNFFTQLD